MMFGIIHPVSRIVYIVDLLKFQIIKHFCIDSFQGEFPSTRDSIIKSQAAAPYLWHFKFVVNQVNLGSTGGIINVLLLILYKVCFAYITADSVFDGIGTSSIGCSRFLV